MLRTALVGHWSGFGGPWQGQGGRLVVETTASVGEVYSEYQSLNHQKPQRSVAGLHTTCDPGAHHGEFGCGGAHGGGVAGETFGSALATPLPMTLCRPATSAGSPSRPAARPPAVPTAAAVRFNVLTSVVLVFAVVIGICAVLLSIDCAHWLPDDRRAKPLRVLTSNDCPA